MSGWAIDEMEPSMFEVLGAEKIIELSTAFYNRVYSEDVENRESKYYRSFGRFFVGKDKEQSIKNQYTFFIERFGGPPLFSSAKGHPALRARHRNYDIKTISALRWLHHMQNAINDVKLNENSEIQQALMEFFEHVAMFLRNREDGPN